MTLWSTFVSKSLREMLRMERRGRGRGGQRIQRNLFFFDHSVLIIIGTVTKKEKLKREYASWAYTSQWGEGRMLQRNASLNAERAFQKKKKKKREKKEEKRKGKKKKKGQVFCLVSDRAIFSFFFCC